MDVQFITSVAVITPDPSASRRLYVDALGLALTAEGDGYLHSEGIDGCKSFGGLAPDSGCAGVLRHA